MNSSLIARGGVPVQLDRERIVFFEFQALALLIAKYGDGDLYTRLYSAKRTPSSRKGEPDRIEAEIKDVGVLAFYLYAGLQEDLYEGEKLTLKQAQSFLCPLTYRSIANAVVVALVNNTASPPQLGKAPAASASPAATAKKKTGPARASTSTKRSGSRSRSSGGRPKRSGTAR